MKKRLEEMIWMECKIRMSEKAMANLLYASIITQSGLPHSYGVGIYQFDRKQNSYNMVDFKVVIHPDNIAKFEEISGVKLTKPISITI